MYQIYELGNTVWCFKQQGDGFVKTSGIVRMAEINKSGYIQYEIDTTLETPEGFKKVKILANHASMAFTEADIDKKIELYNDWEKAQKEDYEEHFGKPDFNMEELEKIGQDLATQRGK